MIASLRPRPRVLRLAQFQPVKWSTQSRFAINCWVKFLSSDGHNVPGRDQQTELAAARCPLSNAHVQLHMFVLN